MGAFDYPGARVIPTLNNLILPAGKSIAADAQQLTLRGRVLDRECKPVPEAMVELWQTGPMGRWEIATREDMATVRPVFAGAGRTYTDFEGYFTFITAFPAPLRYAAPNINFRIKPEGMAQYRSAFFFGNDVRNEKDKTYVSLSQKAKRDLSIEISPDGEESLAGILTIVLPGRVPYRTY